MWDGVKDTAEQGKHNVTNLANGGSFGQLGDTKYRPDSGTPRQGGTHHKDKLDLYDHNMGKQVKFDKGKLHSTVSSHAQETSTGSSITFDNLIEEIGVLSNRVDGIQGPLIEGLQNLVRKHETEISSWNNRYGKLQDTILLLEDFLRNPEKFEQLKKTISEAQSINYSLELTVNSIKSRLEHLQSEVDGLFPARIDSHFAKIEFSIMETGWDIDENKRRIAELESLLEETKPFKQKIKDLESKVSSIESLVSEEIKSSRDGKKNLPSHIFVKNKTPDKLFSALNELNNHRRKLAKLEAKLEILEPKVISAYSRLASNGNELTKLIHEIPGDDSSRIVLNRLAGIERRLTLLVDSKK